MTLWLSFPFLPDLTQNAPLIGFFPFFPQPTKMDGQQKQKQDPGGVIFDLLSGIHPWKKIHLHVVRVPKTG